MRACVRVHPFARFSPSTLLVLHNGAALVAASVERLGGDREIHRHGAIAVNTGHRAGEELT